MQNGHVESFNGRLRDECLNANWFRNLAEAREKIGAWMVEYNGERPHSSLGYRTPNEFAEFTERMLHEPLPGLSPTHSSQKNKSIPTSGASWP